jgi:hypothetical protein
MKNNFIEKYALTVESYDKIKQELNLTTEQFYELAKTLAEEIEVARKVRRLYLRKKITSITIPEFYQWYMNANKKCHYCNISEPELYVLFELLKDKNKRPTRGKSLELERKVANSSYNDLDNLVLCCYMCNNAKSDFFGHEEFKPIGKAINQVWSEILKRK